MFGDFEPGDLCVGDLVHPRGVSLSTSKFGYRVTHIDGCKHDRVVCAECGTSGFYYRNTTTGRDDYGEYQDFIKLN